MQVSNLPLTTSLPEAVANNVRIGFADQKGKFDELVEAKGVRILIEPNALMSIIGTQMDFVSDDLRCVLECVCIRNIPPCSHRTSLLTFHLPLAHTPPTPPYSPLPPYRSEFIFSNPNAKGQCGCGESFTTS
jgi:iron-sulfur cluster assembly protein